MRALADDVAEVSRRVRARVYAGDHPEGGLTQRAVRLPHELRDVVDDASPHGGRLAGRGGGDRAVDAHEKGSDGRRGDASGSYRDRGVRAGGDEVELVVRPRREGTPSASAHFVSIKESTAAAPGGFTLGRSRVSSRTRSVSAGIEYTSPSIPPARLTVARYPAAPIERPVKCRFGGKTRLAELAEPRSQTNGGRRLLSQNAFSSAACFRLIFGFSEPTPPLRRARCFHPTKSHLQRTGIPVPRRRERLDGGLS